MYNFFLDNDVLFYGMFIGMGCHLGYSIAKSYINSFYVDKEIQTDAWDDYSDRPSQILQTSPITDNTITPIFSPINYTNTGAQVGLDTVEAGIQTTAESVSTTTTVLPIPPVNIEMIPNPDIINNIAGNTEAWFTYMDKASALADMLGLGFM